MSWKVSFKNIFSKHKHDEGKKPPSKPGENSKMGQSISFPTEIPLKQPPKKYPQEHDPDLVSPTVLSPSSIYIPCSYLLSCILITLNFIMLCIWTFFFFSLKNDWRDITDVITGYVTGWDLPYAMIIWIALWLVWFYLAILVAVHPIRKFWISSWRPRNTFVRSVHPKKVRLSMGFIHVIFNFFISLITIGIAPFLIWHFAPQLAMAPVRLLETILPPIFLVVQFFYSIAGLPILLLWSSAISKASRLDPNEKSPPCSISLRGIRVLSLLIIGATILWGSAIFFSSLPLWFDSAHFLSGEDLPSKPKLFAHRGLTENGYPENSLSSFKAALQHSDVFGIETDVSISFDGIPFCLHDSLLTRTTNIRGIFPEKLNQPGEGFIIEDLEKLELLGGVNGEKIPTFKALLEELVQYPEKRLIFDLREPSFKGHPHKDKYHDIIRTVIESVPNVFSQIVLLNAGQSLEKSFPTSPTATNYEVVDLLSKGGESAKKKAKSLKQGDVSSTSALPLPSSSGLNLEYLVPTPAIRNVRGLAPPTRSLRAWKNGWSGLVKEVKASMSPTSSTEGNSINENSLKPFWMCMYVLSERHLYSQAWCLGVDAVIANTIENFATMSEPIWWIPQSKMYYYPLFGFLGGALFLFWVLIFLLLKVFGCVASLISCVTSAFCCCCSHKSNGRPKSRCCFLGSTAP